MTHTDKDTQEGQAGQEMFEAMLREKLQQGVRTALISVLEAEVDAFIGAMRSQRTPERRDYRNGHYSRSLDTTIGHVDDLPVPRTRGGYQTQVFERYHRRRNDLDQAIGEMFVAGGRTARVGQVVETLTGTKRKSPLPSPACFTRWRPRMPTGKRVPYPSATPMPRPLGRTSR